MMPASSSITLPPIVTPTLLHCMPIHQHLTPPPMGPGACLSPVMAPGQTMTMAAEATESANQVGRARHATEKTQPMTAPKGAAERGGGGDETVTLFPRRKAGQSKPGGGRGPVVLTRELLEQFYGLPLHVAARRLGICQTAIKKVCRRLGVKKWPFKEMRAPSQGGGHEGHDWNSDEGAARLEEDKPPTTTSQANTEADQTPKSDSAISSAVAALLSLHTEPNSSASTSSTSLLP